MTDMEKKVMVRLCAKIVAETDLYETDKEVQNLIGWVCLSEQIKENNNTIRYLTGEYKKIEPDCREGVAVAMPYVFVVNEERKWYNQISKSVFDVAMIDVNLRCLWQRLFWCLMVVSKQRRHRLC